LELSKNQQANPPFPEKPNPADGKLASQKMPIYHCTCGSSILIVLDLQAMNIAIENHKKEHFKITGETLNEEQLTRQILKAVAASNST